MSFILCPTTISSSSHLISSNSTLNLTANPSPNLNSKLSFNTNRFPAVPLLISSTWRNSPSRTLNFTCRDATITNIDLEDPVDIDWEDENMVGSPWEGAVVYRRNPSTTHLEYCTTLERLGLGKLSTEVSKSKASAMGLRVTKAVKDYPLGTPVLVSVDVCRKKRKLRLDGIIRTVLTLGCNRCGEPAAECVYSNFTLLLTEEPIEDEAEVIDMGLIFGEDRRSRSSASTGDKEEEDEDDDDDDASIDLDDRLYFPAESKEIDISKNIRDLVHIEITINAICDPNCKGLCLKCGANLNTGVCNCSKKQEQKEKTYGPLGNLREQLQKK